MSGILINGVNWSWSSVNNLAFGIPVIGIRGITWTARQQKTNEYGAGFEPISRSYNQITYEASITVMKEWRFQVCKAAPNKNPLAIAPFDWTIAYGSGPTNYTREILKNVEFLEDGTKAAMGDTALIMDIPILIAGVERADI